MNILFATSELYPLVKTGGLADVSYSLPLALQQLGESVTVVMPGYRSVRQKLGQPLRQYRFQDDFLYPDIVLGEYFDDRLSMRLLLVESDSLYDRDGGPYENALSEAWDDNHERFAQFCRAVTSLLGGGCAEYPGKFDVVHCNDWQTGLIPALVNYLGIPIKTVFTIHNLAYQGIFNYDAFRHLSLPEQWWHIDGVEFYGNFSFLKAGIVFSDWVTTVSPTYADEILCEPAACGMGGLLQHHQSKLVGILNGADYTVWNPSSDPNILFHFDSESIEEKTKNKLDLQRHMGLRLSKSTPLIGVVSRLVDQKGVDWILSAMDAMQGEKLQWVVLGTGSKEFEQRFRAMSEANPKTIAVTIGYDETLAHRIEAASDLFAMPSRYEPCGLNQIYSLRYGTLPIVRRTGGLADTVVDADDDAIRQATATGFVFDEPSAEALTAVVRRAIALYSKRKTWKKIQLTAMAQCFDWGHSAQSYLELYKQE